VRLRPLDLPRQRDLRGFLPYLAAGAVYIAIGVAYTPFLLAWYTAMAYLLVVLWIVPAIVRRLR
jgi:hypothetical protein